MMMEINYGETHSLYINHLQNLNMMLVLLRKNSCLPLDVIGLISIACMVLII